MIEPLETASPNIIGFKLSGKLHDSDYQIFIPAVDAALVGRGQVRLFVQFEDIQGWSLAAAWDDFRFSSTHYAVFDRIALVGERQWEERMALWCKPFTAAQVRFFDVSKADAAWDWLREDPLATN